MSRFKKKKHRLYIKITFFSADGCFPQRIEACNNHFRQYGVPVAAYNCEGECELCKLCIAVTEGVPAPECATYCAKGIPHCVATCNAGKAKCLACLVN